MTIIKIKFMAFNNILFLYTKNNTSLQYSITINILNIETFTLMQLLLQLF